MTRIPGLTSTVFSIMLRECKQFETDPERTMMKNANHRHHVRNNLKLQNINLHYSTVRSKGATSTSPQKTNQRIANPTQRKKG